MSEQTKNDEDDNPFVSLGDLLTKRMPVAVLVEAIEEFGIYGTDRFGRFGKADAQLIDQACRYLAAYYEWQNEDRHLSDDPLARTAGDATPYSVCGWHETNLPNFERIQRKLAAVHDSIAHASFARKRKRSKAVPSTKIKEAFVVDPTKSGKPNTAWWAQRMREAKRYGLADRRVRAGKKYHWYPDEVAEWLVEKGHRSKLEVAIALRKHFPECPNCRHLAASYVSQLQVTP